MSVERLGPLPQLPTEVRAGAGANDGDAARDRYTVDLLRCLTEWRARLVQLTDDVNSGVSGMSSVRFTATGAFTFTVPNGVTLVYVTLQAPGGCGGKAAAPAGGGAGELLRRYPYAVTPGAVISGSVGAGVVTTSTANSTFGTLTATGGQGRAAAATGGAGGGALGAVGGAGAGTVGGWQLEVLGGSSGGAGGGAGFAGGPCGQFAGGAAVAVCSGGGASYFAAGASGASATVPVKPGAGAGGGGTITGATGGSGGDGYCLIEY